MFALHGHVDIALKTGSIASVWYIYISGCFVLEGRYISEILISRTSTCGGESGLLYFALLLLVLLLLLLILEADFRSIIYTGFLFKEFIKVNKMNNQAVYKHSSLQIFV
jgi:uncharacterized protein HemY